ncbi:NUDIX hydrolase [Pelomonas sp. KK5]|uniref:NUDIX domain-containing protein n=1 Tax=Pelomonas sp. KK5 TaxID=1855730 RepID=UPI00097C71EC|nr:NUDIX hydrolase [Pelomonas sp. KK5]
MNHHKPEIATTDSRIVYRNRWMTVREDKIVRADGQPGIYGVVEKRDFAAIVAVQEGQVWLVEQFRYPVGRRFWEFPQGSWEDTDVDPLTLARAELREETGLTAQTMIHAGRLFEAYGYSSQAFDLFYATGLNQGERELDAEEQGLIARPFAIAELETMIAEGAIMDVTTVAAFGMLRLKGLI